MHLPLFLALIVSCNNLAKTEVNQRNNSRPSNEGETVAGYLDFEERTIKPNSSVVARLGNTEVEIESGSVLSDARIRLRRMADVPPLTEEEAVAVGRPIGDIVHIEIFQDSSREYLASDELLSDYELRQIISPSTKGAEVGLFAITDPGTDQEQRLLIDPDDLNVEGISASLRLMNSGYRLSTKLRLTSAILWAVDHDPSVVGGIVTKRASQTNSQGSGAVAKTNENTQGDDQSNEQQSELYLAPQRKSISIGGFHACSIISQGRIKCWGRNNDGTLGYYEAWNVVGDEPGELAVSSTAQIGSNLTPIDLSVTYDTCALFSTGQVKCWGNSNAYLGIGQSGSRTNQANEMGNNLPFVDLGTNRIATQITGSEGGYTCALLDDGSVKCWGCPPGHVCTNPIGDGPSEMGDNLTAIQLIENRKVVQVTGSGSHVCMLDDRGAIWCFGSSGTGVLGTERVGDISFSPVSTLASRMLPINLGTGQRAVRISAGVSNMCAILEDRSLKCWGNTQNGLLGKPYGGGIYVGAQSSQMGDHLARIDLGTDFKLADVVIGNVAICAVSTEGEVKCWGSNQFGQLGNGAGAGSVIGDQDGEMGDDLVPVQMGTGKKVKQLFGSSQHSFCARLDDESVKCWGRNSDGLLGIGETTFLRGGQPNQMGDYLPPLVFE